MKKRHVSSKGESVADDDDEEICLADTMPSALKGKDLALPVPVTGISFGNASKLDLKQPAQANAEPKIESKGSDANPISKSEEIASSAKSVVPLLSAEPLPFKPVKKSKHVFETEDGFAPNAFDEKDDAEKEKKKVGTCLCVSSHTHLAFAEGKRCEVVCCFQF